MFVNNEKDLGDAIRQEEPNIELEGELAARIKKLIKLNTILWIFCLTALAVAVAAAMQVPTTAGASGLASLVAGAGGSAIVGVDTAITAVTVAIAGGGIGTLTMLRKYHLKETTNGKIILYLTK